MVASSEAWSVVYHHISASTSAMRKYSASSISVEAAGSLPMPPIMSSFLHCCFIAASAVCKYSEDHKFKHQKIHDSQHEHDHNLRIHDVELVCLDSDRQQQHVKQKCRKVCQSCNQQGCHVTFN